MAGKRSIIMDTALTIINEKGIKALTMPLLIERAHTGGGTFYHHFKDLDDLIKQVYQFCLDRATYAVVDKDDSSLPARERFDVAVRNLIGAYADYPRELDFVYQYSYGYLAPPVGESKDVPSLVLLVNIIEQAQREGVVGDCLPPLLMARVVRSMVATAHLSCVNDGFRMTEKATADFVEAAWCMVCAAGGGAHRDKTSCRFA